MHGLVYQGAKIAWFGPPSPTLFDACLPFLLGQTQRQPLFRDRHNPLDKEEALLSSPSIRLTPPRPAAAVGSRGCQGR